MNNTEIEKHIIDVPDFPKPGIIFKDITPLLEHKFQFLIEQFQAAIEKPNDIEVIIGIESRGFILGCALAQAMGVGFIPIRKKGKLPPPFESESYALEYGTDKIEMKPSMTPKRALLIDDVLATGGTLSAALKLADKCNYQVQEILMLINLSCLNKFKDQRLKALLTY